MIMRKWISIGAVLGFVALAVAVDLGLLDTFDSAVRNWARPHDVWGPTQLRADVIVEGLRPTVAAALLAAFTLVCCARRRSWRPAVFIGVVYLSAVTLAVAVKIAVSRPDPHGSLTNHGGSFPSGHMIGVIVCCGLVVLTAIPRAGSWVWFIPTLLAGLMAASLLVQAAHWSTDVVGGALLATAVLGFASAPRWRNWLDAGGRLRPEPADDHASDVPAKSWVGIERTSHISGQRLLRSWPGKTS